MGKLSRYLRRIADHLRVLRLQVVSPYALGCATRIRWRCRALLPRRRSVQPQSPLVVSLTSIPARFDVLPLTLKCLLTQSLAPDRVVLWIADGDRARLTPEILALREAGLELRFCDDLRSYKKIIPALEAFPDACIVTADDDLYYWPTWLAELVDAYAGDRRTALCHRAHRIAFGRDGQPLAYNEWQPEIRDLERAPHNFPTTGGGVLYPPGIFGAEATNREAFLALCPTADDVWLYWMLRRNGGSARRVARFRELITWPGSQTITLWHSNATNNDLQIAAMTRRFGFPDQDQ